MERIAGSNIIYDWSVCVISLGIGQKVFNVQAENALATIMTKDSTVRYIRVSAFTHKGSVRKTNEDSIVVGAWRRNRPMVESRETTHAMAKTLVAVVIDGMGGHSGGKVASTLASKLIVQERGKFDSKKAAMLSLKKINRNVYDYADSNPGLSGMGATIAGLFCSPEGVTWFNIGDSRIYECYNGTIRQVSIDDSPVPSGEVSHIITQSLGGDVSYCDIQPHVGHLPTKKGAQYVICSDGLSDMIADSDIKDITLAGNTNPAYRLSQLAMEKGGFDNVSVIVLTFE